MAIVDVIILGTLLLLPQSYLLWFNSSEFGAPLRDRLWLFVVPGVLVAARALMARRRERARTDAVVVGLYLAVLALGCANALFRTAFPLNVLSGYGQLLYWLLLVAIFLRAIAGQESTYLLELIRRYYVFVAIVAWTYFVLRLLFDGALPHVAVYRLVPGGRPSFILDNYFLSVGFHERGPFGLSIPRFTFLYREPRILAIHLVVGIALQLGHLWSQVDRAGRRRALWGLAALLGAFVFAHSLFGYILGALLAAYLLMARGLGARLWRSFRALNVAAVATLVPAFWLSVAILGRYPGLMNWIARWTGKRPELVGTYLNAPALAPPALLRFPFGTGIMNVDSPRFEALHGVPTSGAATIIGAFAQDAGLLGVVALGVIVWRILGSAERAAASSANPEVRAACLAVGLLVLASASVVDMLSVGTEGLLILGWVLGAALPSLTADGHEQVTPPDRKGQSGTDQAGLD